MNPKIKVAGVILLAVSIGIACIGVYPALKHRPAQDGQVPKEKPNQGRLGEYQRIFLDDGSCEAFASATRSWIAVKLNSPETMVVREVLVFVKKRENASGNRSMPLRCCILDETGAPYTCFKIAAKRIGENGRWVVRRFNRSEGIFVKGNFYLAVRPGGMYSIGIDRNTRSESGYYRNGRIREKINGTLMARVYGFSTGSSS